MQFQTQAGEQLGTILLTIRGSGTNPGVAQFVLTTGEAKNLGFKLSEGIAKAAIELGAAAIADPSCAGGFCKPMGVVEAEERHDQVAQQRAEETGPRSCGCR